MKSKLILTILIVALVIIGLCAIGVAAVGAQTCSGPANLAPTAQFANIREQANINSKLVTQLQRGSTARADTLTGGWWQLAEGAGYIRADVVTATCLSPTPTRIPASTPHPIATPFEQHIICPSACEITIIIEELP